MPYVAGKRLEMADGSVREIGEPVPEVAEWSDPGPWIRDGSVLYVPPDDDTPLPSMRAPMPHEAAEFDKAARKPKRARKPRAAAASKAPAKRSSRKAPVKKAAPKKGP